MEVYGYALPECEEALREFLGRPEILAIGQQYQLPRVVFAPWAENPAPADDAMVCRAPGVGACVARQPLPVRVMYAKTFFAYEDWMQRLAHTHEAVHLVLDEQQPQSVKHAPVVVRLFQQHGVQVSAGIFRELERLAAVPLEVAVEGKLFDLLPDEQMRHLVQETVALERQITAGVALPTEEFLPRLLAQLARVRFLMDMVPQRLVPPAFRTFQSSARPCVRILAEQRFGPASPVAVAAQRLESFHDADTYLAWCRAFVGAFLTELGGRPVRWTADQAS